jgi:hypothetical protein
VAAKVVGGGGLWEENEWLLSFERERERESGKIK